jgi:hypothetical protein
MQHNSLSGERFPDGSEVSAVNSPVDGSNIPEEEPSPPEDDPEGGTVLVGGAELSEVASPVPVAVVVSVAFVSVEEVFVELISVEVSSEALSVELPAELVAVAVSVELVVRTGRTTSIGRHRVGQVGSILIDVALERSVSFRLDIRP